MVVKKSLRPRFFRSFVAMNQPAVFVRDNYRISFLSSRWVRIQWSPDGRHEDRPSLTFGLPEERLLPMSETLEILQIAENKQDNNWTLTSEHISIYILDTFNQLSDTTLYIIHPMGEWRPGQQDPTNLGGTARTLDGTSGDRIRWNRQNKPLAIESGLLSRSGWTVIDDSQTPVLQEHTLSPLPAGKGSGVGPTDLHFLAYGHDYRAVLQDFTTFAGRIPVPPRYAFGYWWSRYWLYSDAEIRALTQEIAAHDLPLDVMVIDMDWHDTRDFSALNLKLDEFGEWEGWTGYTWNRTLFPAPERLLADLHTQGLRVSLNLHPASGIQPHEAGYEAFATDYGWHFDEQERHPIPFRPEDPLWVICYFKHIIQPLEKDGVDFWWLDWQQYTHSKSIPGLNITFWLNHLFVKHARSLGKRPLIFHRWGGLGNHRYQIGFSGDAYCTWESLAFQPQFTAQAANVGYGYWSHDIGGHIAHGPKTDGEMYLRWLQFGILSPIVRTHASKISRIERRLWQFPAQFAAMRQALHLRYQLVPYLYHAAFQAWETGISLCRPMYLHWPTEEKAYHVPQQYMLGDKLLAAPITHPADKKTGLAQQTIWLPDGEWYDWNGLSLTLHNTQTYTHDEIPLWVKAGAILPLCYGWRKLEQRHTCDTLMVFPGGDGDWQSVWVEDDGESEKYITGEYLKIKMKQELIKNINNDINKLKISWRIINPNHYPAPQARQMRLILPGLGLPTHAQIGDISLSINYDPNKMAVIIENIIFDFSTDSSIEIEWEAPVSEQLALTAGLAGAFRRVQAVVERLKTEVAKKDWGGTLPNVLHQVAGTPTRIGYRPETALTEATQFWPLLQIFKAEIQALTTIDKSIKLWALSYLKF